MCSRHEEPGAGSVEALAALDVDRLARALAKINPPQFAEPKLSGEVNAHLRPWNPHRFTRELARAIAYEYSRPQCAACSLPAVTDGYCRGHARLFEYRVTDEKHWAANE